MKILIVTMSYLYPYHIEEERKVPETFTIYGEKIVIESQRWHTSDQRAGAPPGKRSCKINVDVCKESGH